MADLLFVNSKFTQSVFHQQFPAIRKPTHVVYPGIGPVPGPAGKGVMRVPAVEALCARFHPIYVSINRFEKKKQVERAIDAYVSAQPASIPPAANTGGSTSPTALLVVAGGFDARVHENMSTLSFLQRYCDTHHVHHTTRFPGQPLDLAASAGVDAALSPTPCAHTRRGCVLFLPSLSEPLKYALLAAATALVYTPSHEHFGIVPVEAMAMGTPVVAMANGGPAESVVHLHTGFLCQPPDLAPGLRWAAALTHNERSTIQRQCRTWVAEKFTRDHMVTHLERLLWACRE